MYRPLPFWQIFLVVFFVFPGCTKSADDISNKPVVIVNGKTFTAKEFSDQLAIKLKPFNAIAVKDESIVKSTKENILRDFTLGVLIEVWAAQNNIVVKSEDIENEVLRIRQGYPDDLSFKQALVEEGLDFQEWRKKLSSTLLQKKVAEKIKATTKPPNEDELLSHYNNNKNDFSKPERAHLYQILLSSESDAQAVLDELKKGKDFSAMAKQFSIAPEAGAGGDLGWVEKGLLEVFDDAIKLPQGQRTNALKSPYGYHIVQNRGKKTAQTLPFAEVKDNILLRLMSNREQAVYSAWLESIVAQAQVYRDTILIDSIKVETKGSR